MIRVAPHTAELLAAEGDAFVLEVRGADDVTAAALGLARVATDLTALGREGAGAQGPSGGPAVSNPVLGDGTLLLRVARLGAGDDRLRSIPELVVRRLEEAGVAEAEVRAAEVGGPLDELDQAPNAVVLRLFPPPAGEAGRLPPEWVDVACEWALGDLDGDARVPVRLLGVELSLRSADAPAVVHRASAARTWCDVVNGDPRRRVRTASLTFGATPHVALAAGGPDCDEPMLLARFELLVEVARELAGTVAYACIDIEPAFDHVGLGLPASAWTDEAGVSPNVVAGTAVDRVVPDAYPFQVLGPGHEERRRRRDPGAPPLGDPLPDDRRELAVGEPLDWLPGDERRDDVQVAGRKLLRALLAEAADVAGVAVAEPVELDRVGSGPVLPDLDRVVLERRPHPRRGLHLTFLELVAWAAQAPHSDDPPGIAPALATFTRWLAAGLDDAGRQQLRPFAPRVAAAAADPATDAARAWEAAAWLVNAAAATWLRLAGLTDAAERLEHERPALDADLLGLADLLGTSIVVAARRLEITSSVAGAHGADRAELAERVAWSAWESVSEPSGWVAAGEAAATGIPRAVVDATGLRVADCARDPHVRDELERRGDTVGDAAWQAALRALATRAWTEGWRAAGAVVDGEAYLPLRAALTQAARAAARRAGLDDDHREVAWTTAEAAGIEALTRGMLRRGAGEQHPWDAALRRAAEADTTGSWGHAHELARDAVEAGPWEQGMAAARATLDEIVRTAPEVTGRAVVTALAREAAGAAARAVAVRAAAISLARGATPEGAAQDASAALQPAVVELQGSAIALLERLLR